MGFFYAVVTMGVSLLFLIVFPNQGIYPPSINRLYKLEQFGSGFCKIFSGEIATFLIPGLPMSNMSYDLCHFVQFLFLEICKGSVRKNCLARFNEICKVIYDLIQPGFFNDYYFRDTEFLDNCPIWNFVICIIE